MFGGASFAVNLEAVSYRLINLFEFNLLSRKEIRRLKQAFPTPGGLGGRLMPMAPEQA